MGGRWGCLLITRVLDGGALARWNQDQYRDRGASALPLLPNTLIWRVNGVEGDPRQMAEELCASAGRQQVSLEVRHPPSMRFAKLRGVNLRKKKGWFPQTSQNWSPPWLRQPSEDRNETHGQASSSSGIRRAAQAESLSSRAPVPQIALNLKPPQRRQPPPPTKPPEGRTGF